MNKAMAALSLALTFATALARPHHGLHHPQPVYSAPSGNIDLGYYPPRAWDEIEISGPY